MMGNTALPETRLDEDGGVSPQADGSCVPGWTAFKVVMISAFVKLVVSLGGRRQIQAEVCQNVKDLPRAQIKELKTQLMNEVIESYKERTTAAPTSAVSVADQLGVTPRPLAAENAQWHPIQNQRTLERNDWVLTRSVEISSECLRFPEQNGCNGTWKYSERGPDGREFVCVEFLPDFSMRKDPQGFIVPRWVFQGPMDDRRNGAASRGESLHVSIYDKGRMCDANGGAGATGEEWEYLKQIRDWFSPGGGGAVSGICTYANVKENFVGMIRYGRQQWQGPEWMVEPLTDQNGEVVADDDGVLPKYPCTDGNARNLYQRAVVLRNKFSNRHPGNELSMSF